MSHAVPLAAQPGKGIVPHARVRVRERRDLREAMRIAVPIVIGATVGATLLAGIRSPAMMWLGVGVVAALLFIRRLLDGPLRRRPHVAAFALVSVVLAGRFVPLHLDLGFAVFAHAYYGLLVVSVALFLPWNARWHAAWMVVATAVYAMTIATIPNPGATLVPGVSLAVMSGVASIAGNILVRSRRQRAIASELALRAQRAALHEAQRRLEALAHEDPLTGLSNRRRLAEDIEVLEARLARGHGELGAVMVDLDSFKAYNDAVGHAAGDRALRETAAAIKRAVRAEDRVYRYGGEEILVLVEGGTTETALGVAERIVAAVRNLRLSHPGTPGGQLTVSAGAAGRDGRAAVGPWTVIDEADRALYEAKAAGRDLAAASPVPRPEAVSLTLAS